MRAVCSLRNEIDGKEEPRAIQSTLLAGAIAGFVMTCVVYPLDTLKTRLQCVQGFKAAGGFRGIYKGFWILALGAMPINSVFFGSYETLKQVLEPRISANHAAAATAHMTIASFARLFSLLVRVPVEIAKQRQQVGEGRKGLNAIAILVKAYKREGVRHGLYRGFASTAIRDMPFSFIEMPIWELLKASVRKYTNRRKLTSVQSAACGVVAGGVAGAITTPVDLIKTRIILADAGGKASWKNLRVKVVLRSIYKEGGFKGLFAGVVPRVTMLMIGGFIFYAVYEESRDYLDSSFKEKCPKK